MNTVIFALFLFALLTCCEQSWTYRRVSDGRCMFQTLWGPFLIPLPSREDHEKSGRRRLLRVSNFKAFSVTLVDSSKCRALVQGLKSLCRNLVLKVCLFVKTSYRLD